MPSKKALFIGNGINRLENSSSWEDLLQEIATDVRLDEVLENLKQKPFPLMFEELTNRYTENEGDRDLDTCRKDLIDRVAQNTLALDPNQSHLDILELGVPNILTTNYDYGFERAGNNSQYLADNVWPEKKYSVFRRRVRTIHTDQGGEQTVAIWHIHGEAGSPRSIALGFEHYAGLLQKMRSYVTSGAGSKSKVKSPFVKGDLDFDENIDPKNKYQAVFSWVDIFFRDEIHIVGLELDYSEIDLWWAISYKQYLRLRKKQSSVKKGIPVGETYYYMPFFEELTQAQRAKKALLEGFGVVVNMVSIKSRKQEDRGKPDRKDYQLIYKRLLKNLSS